MFDLSDCTYDIDTPLEPERTPDEMTIRAVNGGYIVVDSEGDEYIALDLDDAMEIFESLFDDPPGE